jgi:hypothetical protein
VSTLSTPKNICSSLNTFIKETGSNKVKLPKVGSNNAIVCVPVGRGPNEKRVVLCRERFQYSCILLRFGNTLGLMPLKCPCLRRTHSYWNLPYNIMTNPCEKLDALIGRLGLSYIHWCK